MTRRPSLGLPFVEHVHGGGILEAGHHLVVIWEGALRAPAASGKLAISSADSSPSTKLRMLLKCP